MTHPSGFREELLMELPGLIEDCVTGVATKEQIARLDRLMIEDEQARRLYVRYAHTLCALRTWSEYQASDAEARDVLSALTALSSSDARCGQGQPDSGAVRPLVLFSAVDHSYGFHFSGWPVAYLIATVVLGIGLVIGAITHVSQPGEFARKLPSPAGERWAQPSQTESVGQVTSMVDCRWSDPATAAVLGARVALGRKIAMSTGLLEITYQSGAKVLLQGPVTYDVESASGGYLAIGKLTARLAESSEARGRRSEVRNQRSEPADQNSQITDHTFVVRTPTAIVTDLGTEFGVEVNKDGCTTSHVFQGTVKMQAVGADGRPAAESRILRANESARVTKSDRGSPVSAIGCDRSDSLRAPRGACAPRPGHETSGVPALVRVLRTVAQGSVACRLL